MGIFANIVQSRKSLTFSRRELKHLYSTKLTLKSKVDTLHLRHVGVLRSIIRLKGHRAVTLRNPDVRITSMFFLFFFGKKSGFISVNEL